MIHSAPASAALPVELDVRVISPRDKHPTIFQTFDGLESGTSMILINDHDPRPLRFQFDANYHDVYSWQYLQAGPDIWRVRIGKSA